MKLLLHVCCGPCACGTIPYWHKRVDEIVAYFFNPNIHPLLEYRRRLTGARDSAAATGTPLVVDEGYDPVAWFAAVSGDQTSRCERCIGMRLESAAAKSVALGCDAFSTTLAISPWQDHEAICARGERAAQAHGVAFVYEDIRGEYPESRRISRELGLYRQRYCGCLVSEWERYREQGRRSDIPPTGART